MKKDDLIELLKEVDSISEIARKLDVSRPTLYKYLDAYCTEMWVNVPPLIKQICDTITSGASNAVEESRKILNVFVETVNQYRNTLATLNAKLKEVNTEMADSFKDAFNCKNAKEKSQLNKKADELFIEGDNLRTKITVTERKYEVFTACMKPGVVVEKTTTSAVVHELIWTGISVNTVAVKDADNPTEYCILFSARKGLTTTVELAFMVEDEPVVYGRYTPEEGMGCVKVTVPNYGVPMYYCVEQKNDERENNSGYIELL